VITSDTEVVPRIFKGDPLLRASGASILEALVGTRSLIALAPAEHLQRRKLLAPTFHGDRMYVYAELAARLVEVELDSWAVGAEVAVHERAMDLTFKVIMTAIFGVSDPEMTQRLTELFQKIMSPGNAIVMFVPQLARRSRWNPVGKRYWRLKDELDSIVRRQIESTRRDPRLGERDDILALLVQMRDEDGSGFDDPTLVDELVALLAGGHETTATAIAWTIDLLLHQPAVLERARTAALDGDDEYLDAVIKESLRFRQPIPLAVARHFLEPFEIGGWTVDEGPTVIVDIDAIHHDPDNYSDPEAFRPERFLGEGETTPFNWIPFGGGAHRCMGAAFALLEMRAMLRGLLTRYQLAPVAAEVERPQRRGVTQAPRGGARVRVVAERRSVPQEA
jgi:cytochrome P450